MAYYIDFDPKLWNLIDIATGFINLILLKIVREYNFKSLLNKYLNNKMQFYKSDFDMTNNDEEKEEKKGWRNKGLPSNYIEDFSHSPNRNKKEEDEEES